MSCELKISQEGDREVMDDLVLRNEGPERTAEQTSPVLSGADLSGERAPAEAKALQQQLVAAAAAGQGTWLQKESLLPHLETSVYDYSSLVLWMGCLPCLLKTNLAELKSNSVNNARVSCFLAASRQGEEFCACF